MPNALRVSQLQSAQPGQFSLAAQTYHFLSGKFTAAYNDFTSQVAQPLPQAWQNGSSSVGLQQIAALQETLRVAGIELNNIATTLDDTCEGLTIAQNELNHGITQAKNLGFTVNDDGTLVSDKPQSPNVPALTSADPSQQDADVVRDLISWALQHGWTVDQDAADLLNRLSALAVPPDTLMSDEAIFRLLGLDDITTLDTAKANIFQATIEKSDIPAKDPKMVPAWWASLTPAEQQALIQHHGDTLGNLNGLPCQLRSDINKARIGPTIASLQRQATVLQRMQSPGWQDKVNDLNNKIHGLQDIQNASADPNVYLLAFDTDDLGHYAVSYGNPDTAANVVTYVPGTGSNLGNAGGDIGRAATMYSKTNSVPGQTASIVWLGYDPPQSILADIPDDAKYPAEAGGVALANFNNGIVSSHTGNPPRTTLLGHSYGSTVAGYALSNGKTTATNAIFIGSPGIPVDNASGLHADNVWAGDITNDPVPFTSATTDPKHLFNDYSSKFGVDPTSAHFRGNVFDAGTGASDGSHNHSLYWATEGPTDVSLRNMANIVTGNNNAVTRAPYTNLASQAEPFAIQVLRALGAPGL